MARFCKEFEEKVAVQFLQNILKHESNRLGGAVSITCLILCRLSCATEPRLFDFIVNCFSISAIASSDGNKDLSDDWELWKIGENKSIGTVMNASNWVCSDKLVSADLLSPYNRNSLKALRGAPILKRWSFYKFPMFLQGVLVCSSREICLKDTGLHLEVSLTFLELFRYNFLYDSFMLDSLVFSETPLASWVLLVYIVQYPSMLK